MSHGFLEHFVQWLRYYSCLDLAELFIQKSLLWFSTDLTPKVSRSLHLQCVKLCVFSEHRALQQLPGLPQCLRNLWDRGEVLWPSLQEAPRSRPGARWTHFPIGWFPAPPTWRQPIRRLAEKVRAEHLRAGPEAPGADEHLSGVLRWEWMDGF